MFARIVAQKLSDNLGKQFYIENVAGASGSIGIGRGARRRRMATHDAHRSDQLRGQSALFGTVPYDAMKDFDQSRLQSRHR